MPLDYVSELIYHVCCFYILVTGSSILMAVPFGYLVCWHIFRHTTGFYLQEAGSKICLYSRCWTEGSPRFLWRSSKVWESLERKEWKFDLICRSNDLNVFFYPHLHPICCLWCSWNSNLVQGKYRYDSQASSKLQWPEHWDSSRVSILIFMWKSAYFYFYIWFKICYLLKIEVDWFCQRAFQCIWEVSWLPVAKGICCLGVLSNQFIHCLSYSLNRAFLYLYFLGSDESEYWLPMPEEIWFLF